MEFSGLFVEMVDHGVKCLSCKNTKNPSEFDGKKTCNDCRPLKRQQIAEMRERTAQNGSGNTKRPKREKKKRCDRQAQPAPAHVEPKVEIQPAEYGRGIAQQAALIAELTTRRRVEQQSAFVQEQLQLWKAEGMPSSLALVSCWHHLV